MRILIHDYAGHPFQVQLSRCLAARGHDVLHTYCGSFSSPRGTMDPRPDDPPSYAIESLELETMIPKTNYFRRLSMEAKYSHCLTDVCQRFQPEVVLSGNTPSVPQKRLAVYCQRSGIRHVFWVQDIYGIAASKLLKDKIPLLGALVGKYFVHLDQTSARLSHALIVITSDFTPIFLNWGVDAQRIHVIQNWAVLEELPVCPRENPWSHEQGLGKGPRFVYTGTLAMKHNPALLLALAEMLAKQGTGELLVVSEGSGVDWLKKEAEKAGLKSLSCVGFQPFERMAEVLGSADVLVAVLEPDAGAFSVPSKVLSYMCAGRALLAAMPPANLAARTIVEQQAGIVVAPDDIEGFCAAAKRLAVAFEERSVKGFAARRYAEEHFDIEQIAERFERVLR